MGNFRGWNYVKPCNNVANVQLYCTVMVSEKNLTSQEKYIIGTIAVSIERVESAVERYLKNKKTTGKLAQVHTAYSPCGGEDGEGREDDGSEGPDDYRHKIYLDALQCTLFEKEHIEFNHIKVLPFLNGGNVKEISVGKRLPILSLIKVEANRFHG